MNSYPIDWERLYLKKSETTQTSADLTNQELLDISEEDTATGSEDILSNDSETEGTPGEAVLTNTTAFN